MVVSRVRRGRLNATMTVRLSREGHEGLADQRTLRKKESTHLSCSSWLLIWIIIAHFVTRTHSARNTFAGSVRTARNAGITAATVVTARSAAPDTANDDTSRDRTP
jgi:hypothetical protein